jgi:hypothetical protein
LDEDNNNNNNRNIYRQQRNQEGRINISTQSDTNHKNKRGADERILGLVPVPVSKRERLLAPKRNEKIQDIVEVIDLTNDSDTEESPSLFPRNEKRSEDRRNIAKTSPMILPNGRSTIRRPCMLSSKAVLAQRVGANSTFVGLNGMYFSPVERNLESNGDPRWGKTACSSIQLSAEQQFVSKFDISPVVRNDESKFFRRHKENVESSLIDHQPNM